MTAISTVDYIKKRWLYYLSYLFIFVLPAAMIIVKTFSIEPNTDKVTISLLGFIIGIVFVFFVAKKIKAKFKDTKPSAFKIIITYFLNIIPFLTIGFLIVLVENALKRFDITIWMVSASIFIGGVMQAIEFVMNKKFLYDLRIEELAREEVDIKKKRIELEGAIEDE